MHVLGGDALAWESLTRRLSRGEAEAIQLALAPRVRPGGLSLRAVRTVAGAACASTDDKLFAAAVLLAFPRLEPLGQAAATGCARIAYASGLRAFREGETMIAAIEGLRTRPDVLFISGHGVAHPRGCGLASHLGLALGLPAIGCARRLIGASASLSAGEPGDRRPLVDDEGRQLGAACVTRPGSRPILVSVGHMVDLGTATALTLACSRGRLFPEPLRLAAAAARAARGA